MRSVKIKENGVYLPSIIVKNDEIEAKFNLENGYIYKRTGIQKRYFSEKEKIEELAVKAVENLFSKTKLEKEKIGLIITATTSSDNLMPGISNIIQAKFNVEDCICLDILAGCSGYINAFEIASLYIQTKKVEQAIVIGVDVLSKYTDSGDIGTAIILSDGSGATLLEGCNEEKEYCSNIKSHGEKSDILTCKANEKIHMDGLEVYKYAVTDTVKNIEQLLLKSNESKENIKYIIPHQSNLKIIKAISKKLKICEDKIYCNIQNVGNTFCASIPIAINEMMENNLLKKGDKVILLGYGGGLNTGSILIEI